MTRGRTLFCLLPLLLTAACVQTARSGAGDANAMTPENVAGRWNVIIGLGGDTISGVAVLTQTGNSISGSIGPDERNQHPLEGVVERGRITLTTLPRPGRTVAFDKAHLIVVGETLKGTIERGGSSDQGTIEFRRMDE